MMTVTKHADFFQGLRIPDLADRIVRIAEDHQCRLRIRELALQIIKIDMVFPIGIDQRAGKDHSAIVEDRIVKDIIDRREDQHLFSRSGQLAHHRGDGRDDAGAEDHPGDIRLPPVPLFPPVLIAFIVCLRNVCVAKYTEFHFAAQCFLNAGGCLEIHVCDAHGDHAFFHIPFHGICAGSFDDRIKNFMHHCHFLSHRKAKTAGFFPAAAQ